MDIAENYGAGYRQASRILDRIRTERTPCEGVQACMGAVLRPLRFHMQWMQQGIQRKGLFRERRRQCGRIGVPAYSRSRDITGYFRNAHMVLPGNTIETKRGEKQ